MPAAGYLFTMSANGLEYLQHCAKRRCGSCQRWQGERLPGETPGTVLLAAETAGGHCLGGPWDGTERRARQACGQWQRWPEIV